MISKVNLLTTETTEQQVFDHVCEHLADQKTQCRRGKDHNTWTCMYRFKGKACAIGSLFPDKMYSENMEGETAAELINKFFPDAEHLTHICILLQNAHDNLSRLDDFKMSLKNIANRFDLNSSKVGLIKEWEWEAM